jgi:hypothetical protein
MAGRVRDFFGGFFGIGLTVRVAGTYIGFTEGGSSLGVAGFVDFSAKGRARLGRLVGLVICRRLFRGFFDIVDGRKRSAGGGALRFGWFGVFGRLIVRTKERWLCFKRATHSVFEPSGFGIGSAVTRQYSDRPVAARFLPRGHWG